jgi:hypothetical protein
MYKTVEVRGSRCHRGLLHSRVYNILFCSVLGTVQCSRTQMVEYGKEVEAT